MQTLLEILNTKKYNTDKHTSHEYIQCFYDDAFLPFKNQPVNMLEIGVLRCESLKLWHDYFVNANNIVGVDIFNRVSFEESTSRLSGYNVKLHRLNSVTATEKELDEFIGKYPDKFDIIIDDGSHVHSDQLATYNNFKPFMKKGGLYIIEDLGESAEVYRAARSFFAQEIPDMELRMSFGKRFATLFGVIQF